MFDRALAVASQLRQLAFGGYTPEELAGELIFFDSSNSQSDTLEVVFPYWRISRRTINKIGQRMSKRGADVLMCCYHPEILHNDPAVIREAFEFIAKKVGDTVTRLTQAHKYGHVNILALSLGTVSADTSLQYIPRFDKVTYVVPGSTLLSGVWNGIRTRRVRRALEDRGATYDKLNREWAQLGPIAHVGMLKGHEVHVVLAENDQFAPYEDGIHLVEAMRAQDIVPCLQTSRLGHALTIAQYLRKV